MIEDFEDWRLKCLMLVKRWHHIEPSGISETLPMDCFAEELPAAQGAKVRGRARLGATPTWSAERAVTFLRQRLAAIAFELLALSLRRDAPGASPGSMESCKIPPLKRVA
jgi:hypothetical protein